MNMILWLIRMEFFLIILLILDIFPKNLYTIWNLVLSLYVVISWLGIGIVMKIEKEHKPEKIQIPEFLALPNMENWLPNSEAEEMEGYLRSPFKH